MVTAQYLKNRSAVDNRYSLTQVFVDDAVAPGRRRYGLWKYPAITSLPELDLPEGTYDRYTVTQADIGRIDLIAWRAYQEASWWWVIALVNKIADPFRDLVVGQVLLIPKREVVTQAMESEL